MSSFGSITKIIILSLYLKQNGLDLLMYKMCMFFINFTTLFTYSKPQTVKVNIRFLGDNGAGRGIV